LKNSSNRLEVLTQKKLTELAWHIIISKSCYMELKHFQTVCYDVSRGSLLFISFELIISFDNVGKFVCQIVLNDVIILGFHVRLMKFKITEIGEYPFYLCCCNKYVKIAFLNKNMKILSFWLFEPLT